MANVDPKRFQFETEVLAAGIDDIDDLAKDIMIAFKDAVHGKSEIDQANVDITTSELIRISFRMVAGSWKQAQTQCQDVIRTTFAAAGVTVDDDEQRISTKWPATQGTRHLENYGTELALA